MASLESSDSPPALSFRITDKKGLLRSVSTKEPSLAEAYFSPARLSHSAIPPASSSPYHSLNPPKLGTSQFVYRCISSMLKKDGQILSIAVSNGLVYTGSQSNCIRIWKLPEFTECGQLKTKTNMACALAVSNDLIFAAYADFRIRAWRRTFQGAIPMYVRLTTARTVGSFLRSYIAGKDMRMMKHLGPITSLAINTSDDLLYSASGDKTVKVWRISNLKCIETIQAHSEPVNAIVVGKDCTVYTASDDATVRVWRRVFCTRERPHSLALTLPAKSSPVKALALTADGGILYSGCTDGYIHYWNKAFFSGQLQYGGALVGHTHAVTCLASTAKYVASGSADCTGRVWMREQNGQHTCIAVLEGHRGPIRCLTAYTDHRSGVKEDEDGCTVCTGSLDGVLKVWHVRRHAS